MQTSALSRSPLTLQQLAGAALRLQQRKSTLPRDCDLLFLVEAARDRLLVRPYQAEPLPAYRKSKATKIRIICNPSAVDRVINEAVLREIEPTLEPLLSDAVHAYRRGRSVYSAGQALVQMLADGRRHVRLLDIASYYDSLDRTKLANLLQPLLQPALLRLLMAQLAAPLRLDGRVIKRPRGIPTGCAISPAIANAFLLDLDRRMQQLPCGYLRYGDDLLVAASTCEEADQAERELRAGLQDLGLAVAEQKVVRAEYAESPIAYLGLLVSDKGIYERVAHDRLERITASTICKRIMEGGSGPDDPPANPDGEVNWRRQRTLYITEPGFYLSFRDAQAIIRHGGKIVREIPFRHIDRVLVLAGAAMSSGFISACVVRNIPLLVFVNKGRAYGSLVAAGMPNPLRLRAQYDLLSDPPRRLALARSIVDAKLQAMQRRLRNVANAAPQRQAIDRLSGQLASAHDSGTLRGLEGQASKVYYEGFALRIKPPQFAFVRRSRRPPKDAINSLLSFSYSLIFGEMQTSLLACGLDPHAGVFHELQPGHPALASDLVEPYRALIADSFVLAVVNQGVLLPSDFTRERGGVFMTAQGRKTYLGAYEGFMVRPLGGARGHTPPRGLIQAGARAFLGIVMGEAEHLVMPLLHGDDTDVVGSTS